MKVPAVYPLRRERPVLGIERTKRLLASARRTLYISAFRLDRFGELFHDSVDGYELNFLRGPVDISPRRCHSHELVSEGT